jgi:heat shock protein HslJ
MNRHFAPLRLGVVVLLAAGLLAGCGEAGPGVAIGSDSIDGSWKLVSGSAQGRDLPLDDAYPVTLDVDGDKASGRSACNSYFATAEYPDDTVRFGSVGGTEMACEDDAMNLEADYMTALAAVSTARTDGDRLVLQGDGVRLEYGKPAAVPTADLVGTTWVLDALLDGDTASSTSGRATLLLHEDGRVEGSTGCRGFTGKYAVDGDQVKVTRFNARDPDQDQPCAPGQDQPCAPGQAAQDSHVLTVLHDGFEATVDEAALTLASEGRGLSYRAE